MRDTLKNWLAILNAAGAIILLIALTTVLFLADMGRAAEAYPARRISTATR